MKTETDNSVKNQNATCDNAVLSSRLFRGFSIKHNNWIYGDLIHTPEKRMRIINYTDISSDGVDNFITINEIVESNSVGQCTGVFDRNADDIYEGDIYTMGDKNIKYKVVWHDSGFIGKQLGSSSYAGLEHWRGQIKIIGNVFKNPELL
jgi:YopX protein